MNKKNITIATIAVIIAFIFGYSIGDTTAIDTISNHINAKLYNEPTKIEAKQVTENKNEKATIFKAGVDGVSGNWSMKVLEAKETTTIESGDSSYNIATAQKFIVVKLQIKNISKSSQQYSPDEFKLGDMNTKSQYSTALEAMQAAINKEIMYKENVNFSNTYDKVTPNIPRQTYIIFEVPSDMNISDGVLINKNEASKEAKGFYIK